MKGPEVVFVQLIITAQVNMRLSIVEKDRPLVVTDMTMGSMNAVDLRFDL